jgi:hypothetical protein
VATQVCNANKNNDNFNSKESKKQLLETLHSNEITAITKKGEISSIKIAKDIKSKPKIYPKKTLPVSKKQQLGFELNNNKRQGKMLEKGLRTKS